MWTERRSDGNEPFLIFPHDALRTCPTPPESRTSSLRPFSTHAGMARLATLGSSVWGAILIGFRKTMHITGSSIGPALQNGGKSNSNYAKEVRWRLSTVFIVSAGAITTIFLRRNILLNLTRLRPQKNQCFRSFGEAYRVKLECDIEDGMLSKACRPCYDKITKFKKFKEIFVSITTVNNAV